MEMTEYQKGSLARRRSFIRLFVEKSIAFQYKSFVTPSILLHIFLNSKIKMFVIY